MQPGDAPDRSSSTRYDEENDHDEHDQYDQKRRRGGATGARARRRGHTAWRIDPVAARAAFAIRKRLMFVRTVTVTGHFTGVSGIITLDEHEPSTAQAEVTIDAASIDTQNARRDKHLRTVDFFHVEEHPHLTFTSRRIAAVDRVAGTYRVSGELTVRGVTRIVTLDALHAARRRSVRAAPHAQAHGAPQSARLRPRVEQASHERRG